MVADDAVFKADGVIYTSDTKGGGRQLQAHQCSACDTSDVCCQCTAPRSRPLQRIAACCYSRVCPKHMLTWLFVCSAAQA